MWARAAVWTGVPAAGAGLGWVIHQLPGWILRIPFVPMRGPLRLAARLPEPEATIGALLLGALGGLVLAFLVDLESMTVRMSRTEVTLTEEAALPRHRRRLDAGPAPDRGRRRHSDAGDG